MKFMILRIVNQIYLWHLKANQLNPLKELVNYKIELQN